MTETKQTVQSQRLHAMRERAPRHRATVAAIGSNALELWSWEQPLERPIDNDEAPRLDGLGSSVMIDGFAVVERIPVLWGDMDAFGHVNNTRFIRWFETARIAHFQQMGIETVEAVGVAPILAHVSCDFIAPVDFPNDILVGARVTKIGNTSFHHEYVIVLSDDPAQPVARGTGVIVMYDYSSGHKVPIPEDLRARISELDGVGG